jgi:hypothetical protein
MAKRRADVSRRLEVRACGVASGELLELATRHDRRALVGEGEFLPFHFRERFFVETFDGYLDQAQNFGWPAFYLSHFAGLYPIGATPGGDYWLARIEADAAGRSRVYRYDHETGELGFAFPSIAALLRGQRAKAKALAPSDDPIALWRRASWAADFVGAGALEPWTTSLVHAATLATFTRERAELAGRADLVAYWLVAHALLGNVDAFAVAYEASAKATNPFVVALRARAKALLAGTTLDAFAFGKLTGVDMVLRLQALRKAAASKLRAGSPPPLPETGPTLTLRSVMKIMRQGKLLALVEQNPAKDRLHLWTLHQIETWSKTDRGPVSALERIADTTLTRERLKQMGAWVSITPLVADDGAHESMLLELLVKRKAPRAGEIVLRTLAIMEKNWTRIRLATRAAKLAAAIDARAARPILVRMVADPTWRRYETEAMPQLNAALRRATVGR